MKICFEKLFFFYIFWDFGRMKKKGETVSIIENRRMVWEIVSLRKELDLLKKSMPSGLFELKKIVKKYSL